jgi:uridylate kinase
MPTQKAYKRILLKLSGEAFLGHQKFGVEEKAVLAIAEQIKELQSMGVEVGVVIGGGNLFRGIQAQSLGLERNPADQVGMLATIINGIILNETLNKIGAPCRVLSALECDAIVPKYSWQKALKYLSKKEIVIFVGGTSHPYFTTDTAAALRASEIKAEILMKLTKVDGIYDKDPKQHPNAVKYTKMTYSQILAGGLEVMDLSAVALCKASGIPICVFDLATKDSLKRAVLKEHVGTLVTGG